jgi:hypothetical protein
MIDLLVRIVRSSSLETSFLKLRGADRLVLANGVIDLDNVYAEPSGEANGVLADHAVRELHRSNAHSKYVGVHA